jgi:hypothetical protein
MSYEDQPRTRSFIPPEEIEPVEDEGAQGELGLWRAVVLRALFDLVAGNHDNATPGQPKWKRKRTKRLEARREDARDWFFKDARGLGSVGSFEWVCVTCSYDPARVRSVARRINKLGYIPVARVGVAARIKA